MSKARDTQWIQTALNKLTGKQLRILRKALEMLLNGKV